MRMLFSFTIFMVLGFAMNVLAQVVGVPADPTWGDGILSFLASPAMLLSVVGFLVESAMRLWPTAIPLSLLIPIKYALKVIQAVIGVLMQIIDMAIVSANNVKPASLK